MEYSIQPDYGYDGDEYAMPDITYYGLFCQKQRHSDTGAETSLILEGILVTRQAGGHRLIDLSSREAGGGERNVSARSLTCRRTRKRGPWPYHGSRWGGF